MSAIAAAGGLDDAAAVSVGAQQHGMVCLDAHGKVVRPALLWNDTRSAAAADDLVSELGARAWAEAVGVVPLAAITVSKLRWLADHEPANADRTATVCLPHDWLSWRLRGETDPSTVVTDRSDASGTGYFDAMRDVYDDDLLELALRGRHPALPRVLAPGEGIRSGPGAVFGAGLGDNAAAALGLGADDGDVIVSIGTSGVVSAIAAAPARDAAGFVAGFADGTGRHLPLVCTLNGARVLDAAAALLRVDHDELSRLALSAPAGSEGLVMVPYLEGERTPNRPDATGAVHGLRVANATAANLARASVEGLLCALADGLDHLTALGVPARRVLLIGGGAKSAALREIAPTVFGVPVHVPLAGEYVAIGAARQAAWAHSGQVSPPDWNPPPAQCYEATAVPAVRSRYGEVSDLTEGSGGT